MLVCRPGPGQEILPAGLKKKNRPRKTNPRGKKKTNAPSPRSLPASGQKKTNASQKEKGAAKGKSLLSPDGAAPAGSFSPPGRCASPGSAQEILPAGLKEEQAQENKPQRQEKQFWICFFLLASDGKPTIKFTFPYKTLLKCDFRPKKDVGLHRFYCKTNGTLIYEVLS